MPIHYGSQLDEHHLVRREAGVFDVSHMTVVDLRGDQVKPFLRRLLANSIDKLKVTGKALYSCMLNPRGGVIDDLIVYYLGDDFFRMVVNASTREKDLAWLREQAAPFGVSVEQRPDRHPRRTGPQARDIVIGLAREADRAALTKLGRFAALRRSPTTASSCLSPAPATPVKTVSRSCCRRMPWSPSGTACWRQA